MLGDGPVRIVNRIGRGKTGRFRIIQVDSVTGLKGERFQKGNLCINIPDTSDTFIDTSREELPFAPV